MEYTGNYYTPIANYLHENGIFVSVINPLLIKNYNENSIRKVKTDPKDALKIASFSLDRWTYLTEYKPADELRNSLKILNRQYIKFSDIRTAIKNNLISLLDISFPGINEQFTSPKKDENYHEKWEDFALEFWHKDKVAKICLSDFKRKYKSFCNKNGYKYSESKAESLHSYSRNIVATISMDQYTETIITENIRQLNHISETLASLMKKMNEIAESLPEYQTVIEMHGVGKVFAPQLIAEIGDISRFKNRRSITAYAGLDPTPNESGKFVGKRSITKKGSSELRKILFLIAKIYAIKRPCGNPIYDFYSRKRSEGKHYYACLIATANKFLRFYYAKVKSAIKF